MNATTSSSDSQEEVVEFIVQSIAEFFVVNYIDLAAFALLVFDYVITFDNEVRFAWCRKYSWAKIIFLFNRYLSIALYFLSLGPLLPTNSLLRRVHSWHYVAAASVLTFTLLVSSCKVLNYTMQTVTVLLYGVWAAFSGLRVYAISGRNWIVTVVVLLLALVPPMFTSGHLDRFLRVSVMTRGCLLISEGIVITVTWIKTYHTARSAVGGQVSFTTLVLREGMLYFCVVFVLNVVQIAFTFAEGGTFALILVFLNVLIPILISRWYFDLDDLKREVSSASLPSSRSNTLRFAKTSRMSTVDFNTSSDGILQIYPLAENGPPVPEKKLVCL
ncbi:hypothetical protein C8Q78DRAFT_1079284 [Trametes maxima]|nr:hypothetical protein C8Q78DRAFT_1079284 [Trametes maxima]